MADAHYEELLGTMIDGWNRRDIPATQACFVEDCIYEDMAFQVTVQGHDGLRSFMEEVYETMDDDFRVVHNFRFVKGNRGAADWTITATHKGLFEGVDRTGKKISFTGLSVFTFRDGLIESARDCWDYATMMRMYGVVNADLAKLEKRE